MNVKMRTCIQCIWRHHCHSS